MLHTSTQGGFYICSAGYCMFLCCPDSWVHVAEFAGGVATILPAWIPYAWTFHTGKCASLHFSHWLNLAKWQRRKKPKLWNVLTTTENLKSPNSTKSSYNHWTVTEILVVVLLFLQLRTSELRGWILPILSLQSLLEGVILLHAPVIPHTQSGTTCSGQQPARFCYSFKQRKFNRCSQVFEGKSWRMLGDEQLKASCLTCWNDQKKKKEKAKTLDQIQLFPCIQVRQLKTTMR